jgi:AcrR family transcriptional regulator
MSKGDATRQAILERALSMSSVVGLEGISIGRLADDLALSKSGLFAHFRSKEALQLQVLEVAVRQFVESVVRPALKEQRGEPRLRALFERWLDWARSQSLPGGCIFVSATMEMDDRPGPVRDALARYQQDWVNVLATATRAGQESGAFRGDLEPAQFAQEAYGLMLSYHLFARLLRDPHGEARARAGFDALLKRAVGPVRQGRKHSSRRARNSPTRSATRSR